MDSKVNYKVIGLMSGTSLDGVDIALCSFRKKGNKWSFKIQEAETFPYTTLWRDKLSMAPYVSGEELMQLHSAYGRYLGKLCERFIERHSVRKIEFISSHGHTVFHQPDKGFTFQLGDGNAIHAITGLPVTYDFRSLDVVLGGQGAPLVPIGDQLLFNEYDACLNLGGIANLSMKATGGRKAFDICFANMGLNYLAMEAGKEFDKGGTLASNGQISKALRNALTKVYSKIGNARPSLSREFFELKIQPLLSQKKIPNEDRLATFTESIAIEIVKAVPSKSTVLCTGGGAFNGYLMDRLIEHAADRIQWIIPDPEVIKYKEALVFAFLGVLRLRNETNCLKSVTGALRNSSSGVMAGF